MGTLSRLLITWERLQTVVKSRHTVTWLAYSRKAQRLHIPQAGEMGSEHLATKTSSVCTLPEPSSARPVRPLRLQVPMCTADFSIGRTTVVVRVRARLRGRWNRLADAVAKRETASRP